MADTPRQIADTIVSAIVAQALPPGTKLAERELAELFNTSRAVVKQALLIVSESGLVDTRANRGASVAQLSQREAYDLIEAITALEQGLAFQLMQRLTPSDWDALQVNVDQVEVCMAAGDNSEADRIGPIFHDIFLELSGNRILQDTHARLSRQLQLMRALYVNQDYHRCKLNDDHRDLLDLLRAGHVTEALKLIANHYQAISRGYDLDAPAPRPETLSVALAPWLDQSAAA